MEATLDRVDNAKWTRPHWSVFASLVVGFFMWGVIASLAPLFYPSVKATWFLILPILAQVAGDLGLPRLSDLKLGRKTVFFLTLLLYGMGSVLITISVLFLASNLLVIVIGIVLAYAGVEGEIPTGLSYAAEIFPLRMREKMLVLISNFDNLGAMVAGLIGFITYSFSDSLTAELEFLGIFALVLLIVTLGIRYTLPESVRWLASRGENERAEAEARKFTTLEKEIAPVPSVSGQKTIGLAPRLALLITMGISQYLTYGLMTYIVADYYFQGNAINFIVVVANSGAFVAGFIAVCIMGRLKVRSFSLFAYWGGFLTMIPILLVAHQLAVGSDLPLFYLLLFLSVAFSEFAWAVREILEPILMPSKSRAFLIGVVRLGPMLSYAASIYFTASYSFTQFIEYNMVLWIVGGLAAIFWFAKGYNVEMLNLERTSLSEVPLTKNA